MQNAILKTRDDRARCFGAKVEVVGFIDDPCAHQELEVRMLPSMGAWAEIK